LENNIECQEHRAPDLLTAHYCVLLKQHLMDKTRFYCNTCKNATWHEIVAEHQQSHHDFFWDADKLFHGQILKCSGCDSLSFRLYEHPFEFDTSGKVVEHIYPTRELEKRERKYFGILLPEGISKIYVQTNDAYDNELYLLAAIGLRTLIEAIVVKKLPPNEYSASIQSKIEALKKHFSAEVINTLQEFRFMGNKATHELEEPDKLDIHRALNVVEDIMTFFFSVEDSAYYYRIYKKKKSGG